MITGERWQSGVRGRDEAMPTDRRGSAARPGTETRGVIAAVSTGLH